MLLSQCEMPNKFRATHLKTGQVFTMKGMKLMKKNLNFHAFHGKNSLILSLYPLRCPVLNLVLQLPDSIYHEINFFLFFSTNLIMYR